MPDDVDLMLVLLHHDVTPAIGAGVQGGQVVRVASLDDVVWVLQAKQCVGRGVDQVCDCLWGVFERAALLYSS